MDYRQRSADNLIEAQCRRWASDINHLVRPDAFANDPYECARGRRPGQPGCEAITKFGRIVSSILLFGDSILRSYIFKYTTVKGLELFYSSWSGGKIAAIMKYCRQLLDLCRLKKRLIVLQGTTNDVSNFVAKFPNQDPSKDETHAFVTTIIQLYISFIEHAKLKSERLLVVALLPRFDSVLASWLVEIINERLQCVCWGEGVSFHWHGDQFEKQHFKKDGIHLQYLNPRRYKTIDGKKMYWNPDHPVDKEGKSLFFHIPPHTKASNRLYKQMVHVLNPSAEKNRQKKKDVGKHKKHKNPKKNKNRNKNRKKNKKKDVLQ